MDESFVKLNHGTIRIWLPYVWCGSHFYAVTETVTEMAKGTVSMHRCITLCVTMLQAMRVKVD